MELNKMDKPALQASIGKAITERSEMLRLKEQINNAENNLQMTERDLFMIPAVIIILLPMAVLTALSVKYFFCPCQAFWVSPVIYANCIDGMSGIDYLTYFVIFGSSFSVVALITSKIFKLIQLPASTKRKKNIENAVNIYNGYVCSMSDSTLFLLNEGYGGHLQKLKLISAQADVDNWRELEHQYTMECNADNLRSRYLTRLQS